MTTTITTAAELVRFLADARAEYDHADDDDYLSGQISAGRTLAAILAGEDDAHGWLPSWRWAEFDALMASYRPGVPAEPQPVIDADHLVRQREWSRRTFGPGPRAAGVVAHIRKELEEVEAAPSDVTEWADVVILALDGAWRAGHEPQTIIDAIKAKQARNEAREWPDWRTASPDAPIEHSREADTYMAEPQRVTEPVSALSEPHSEPQRVQPSREDVVRAIEGALRERAETPRHPAWIPSLSDFEAFYAAADAIRALIADQPTVAEVVGNQGKADGLSAAIRDIAYERLTHEQRGWTAEHDAEHGPWHLVNLAEDHPDGTEWLATYTAKVRAQAFQWVRGRWWRAVDSTGAVWRESSDEQEVRQSARPGDRIERMWVTAEQREWREAEGGAR
jgi:hypothetical protein